jgi:hypothetical protein
MNFNVYNMFQYIPMYLKVFECLSIYLNVFTNIIIGISPSNFHYIVFAMCIHLYICFSLSTMTPFPTCFTTTLFSHVPIDLLCVFFWMIMVTTNLGSNCHYNTLSYSLSPLVARSIMEPKFYFWNQRKLESKSKYNFALFALPLAGFGRVLVVFFSLQWKLLFIFVKTKKQNKQPKYNP